MSRKTRGFTLIELSGAAAGRMVCPLVPPVLSGAFRVLNPAGEVSRSDYFFQINLPDAAGAALPEPQAGYVDDPTGGTVGMGLADTTWCCYAWPVNCNQSGNRTCFTNQAGDVIACEDAAYSGTTSRPLPVAAFEVAGLINGNVAIGPAAVSVDGNTRRQVN